eukprot:scaffold323_cov232-Pinguiococcus_pyrenoidosus.AAC.1
MAGICPRTKQRACVTHCKGCSLPVASAATASSLLRQLGKSWRPMFATTCKRLPPGVSCEKPRSPCHFLSMSLSLFLSFSLSGFLSSCLPFFPFVGPFGLSFLPLLFASPGTQRTPTPLGISYRFRSHGSSRNRNEIQRLYAVLRRARERRVGDHRLGSFSARAVRAEVHVAEGVFGWCKRRTGWDSLWGARHSCHQMSTQKRRGCVVINVEKGRQGLGGGGGWEAVDRLPAAGKGKKIVRASKPRRTHESNALHTRSPCKMQNVKCKDNRLPSQ